MSQRYGRGLHDVDSVCIADFAVLVEEAWNKAKQHLVVFATSFTALLAPVTRFTQVSAVIYPLSKITRIAISTEIRSKNSKLKNLEQITKRFSSITMCLEPGKFRDLERPLNLITFN